MQIATTRFGSVEIDADDIILFPMGLIGFEDCRHWVLLGDTHTESVGWLQCVSRPELALPFVSPRRFVPDYRVRVLQGDLVPLQLHRPDQAYVLAVISKDNSRLTMNLKAPILINLDRHLGRQIITTDDQPLQYELAPIVSQLRKSA